MNPRSKHTYNWRVRNPGKAAEYARKWDAANLKRKKESLRAWYSRLRSAAIDQYGGGPVGVETLAALTSEERSTIEDFYEPYLLQIGLLERTPRGRKATAQAFAHLGKTRPAEKSQASLLG